MARCRRFRSGSLQRPVWTLPTRFARQPAMAVALRRRWLRRKVRNEALADPDRAEPADAVAHGLCAVHRDRTGRGTIRVGARAVHHRGTERWPGWIAGAQTASTDAAGAISRPNCR